MLPMSFRRFKLINRSKHKAEKAKAWADASQIVKPSPIKGTGAPGAIPVNPYDGIEAEFSFLAPGSELLGMMVITAEFRVTVQDNAATDHTFSFHWSTPVYPAMTHFEEVEVIIMDVDILEGALPADMTSQIPHAFVEAYLTYGYLDPAGNEVTATVPAPEMLAGTLIP